MSVHQDVLIFRKFQLDEMSATTDHYLQAAVDKLQTLYPGNTVTRYDGLSVGISTDSLYSDTGIDMYELGMVDEEIPAIRNRRDGTLITFRV